MGHPGLARSEELPYGLHHARLTGSLTPKVDVVSVSPDLRGLLLCGASEACPSGQDRNQRTGQRVTCPLVRTVVRDTVADRDQENMERNGLSARWNHIRRSRSLFHEGYPYTGIPSEKPLGLTNIRAHRSFWMALVYVLSELARSALPLWQIQILQLSSQLIVLCDEQQIPLQSAKRVKDSGVGSESDGRGSFLNGTDGCPGNTGSLRDQLSGQMPAEARQFDLLSHLAQQLLRLW